MRIQTSTLIALVAVLELARQSEEQVPAAAIAKEYGISPHHLAKVLNTLTRAGMVRGARGAGGGYQFSGNARRMTLLDVMTLFERIPEGSPMPATDAQNGIAQALAQVLQEVDDMMIATFNSITIETLLKLSDRLTAAGGTLDRAAATEASQAEAR